MSTRDWASPANPCFQENSWTKNLSWVDVTLSLGLWWPTTVTAKPKTSRQKQNTSRQNQKTSRQKQNTSPQNQKPHGKTKYFTAKAKYLWFCRGYLLLPWGIWTNWSWGLWFCLEVFGFVVRYFVFAVRFLVLPWQLWATVLGVLSCPVVRVKSWKVRSRGVCLSLGAVTAHGRVQDHSDRTENN